MNRLASLPVPHRHRRRTTLLAAGAPLVALISALGCDRKPNAPTPSTPRVETTAPATLPVPASPPTAASRPTTQELVSGNRKPVVLGPLPLVMDLPPSWTVLAAGSSAWIEGFTPHGDVKIQLISTGQQTFNAHTLELLDARLQKEAKANASKLVYVPLHPVGGVAKASERREFSRNAVPDAQGQPEQTDVVDWEVKVFIPQGNDFAVDLLDFSPIRKTVYDQDREFLEKILATLHYDATKGLLQ